MQNESGMSPPNISQNPPQTPTQPVYAGFWVRLAANIIDTIIVIIPSLAIAALSLKLLGIEPFVKSNQNYFYLIVALIWMPINLFFVTRFGATPGKMFYGLKIVGADMSYPKLGTAFLREILGKIASGAVMNIGYYWVAFDGQKQGWHDKIAGTHVILLQPVKGIKKISVYFFAIGPLLLLILLPLAVIALIAINPAKQFSQANDTKRTSDVNAILNAIDQYKIDNGTFPTGVLTTEQSISTSEANICLALIGQYLAALPVDPKKNSQGVTNCNSPYDTGYTVVYSPNDGSLTVKAPLAERRNIFVTR